jgi:hypothetical protein
MKRFYFFVVMGMALMSCLWSCTGKKSQGNGTSDGDSLAMDVKGQDDGVVWQDVSDEDAIAFIEDFYSHAPEEPGSYDWDEDILKKYLAPAVLDTLHAKVDVYSPGGEAKYATWLLTGIDDSEQVYVSRENFETRRVEDGRYIKRFEVYYWADGMLDGVQELFYTVKSNGTQLFITQIDGLDESGAEQVWDMLEERNRWREVESEAEEMEGDE